ncbi:MAG: ATP synthase A1 subunit C [Thermoplasmata archaeon]
MTLSGEAGHEGNYAYTCARVKARRALLLPPDTYPRLLKMGLSEIGRFIGEGQYRSEVEELSGRYGGVDLIERATYLNLARTYNTIIGFTRGELRELVRRYLNRWDVWNFKTVLRGRLAGISWSEVEGDIVPAGVFNKEDFAALFAAADINEMISVLKREGREHDFEPLLLRLLGEKGEVPVLADLENALEKSYYERLLRFVPEKTQANRLFLQFLRVETDIVNLKTLFRLKAEASSPEAARELLVDGGEELDPSKLRKLVAAEGIESLLQCLVGTKIYESIREPATRIKNSGSLHEVFLALDRYLLERARRFSHTYPLSVIPVMDYLLRKKIEVDNLRTIARGKQSGLPEEVIRGLLFT